MADPVLSLRGAGHSYNGQTWQFRKLNLDCDEGDVIAILGPNGGGKSTLLRTMAGLLRPSEGDVRSRCAIAFVPQDLDVAFPYSAQDMVLMGRARHVKSFRMPTATDEGIASDALCIVGLVHHARRPFSSLSGGERQLVLIARALASQAPILLLDEPASALDLRNQDVVLALIDRLAREGRTIIFSTHEPNHAIAVASNTFLMRGQAPIFGSLNAVMTEHNLESLYGMRLRLLPFEDNETRWTAVVPLIGPRRRGKGTVTPGSR